MARPPSRPYPNARPQSLTFSLQISLSEGAPDGMFTAGTAPSSQTYQLNSALTSGASPFHQHPRPEGPISESDFFTWEALIVGPKDTPFEGGVFPAILTFVRTPHLRCARATAHVRHHANQPPSYMHISDIMPSAVAWATLVPTMTTHLRPPPWNSMLHSSAFRLPPIAIQDEV